MNVLHTENLSDPVVVLGTHTPPKATSRTRAWAGLVVEEYDQWLGTMVAEYPFHAISLQLSGTRDILQRRGRLISRQTTQKGTLIITPCGGPKEWTPGEQSGSRFVVVNVSPRLADSILEDSGHPQRQHIELLDNFGTHDHVLETLLRSLLAESRNEELANGPYVEALRDQLVVHLLRHYSTHKRMSLTSHAKLSPRKLMRASDFIEANLASELTVSSIAAAVCMSPTNFARSFKEAVGLTPHKYVLERRIAAGMRLLRDSDAQVAQIAHDVGFSTASHFSVSFSRMVGKTPREYRTDG